MSHLGRNIIDDDVTKGDEDCLSMRGVQRGPMRRGVDKKTQVKMTRWEEVGEVEETN